MGIEGESGNFWVSTSDVHPMKQIAAETFMLGSRWAEIGTTSEQAIK